ncbi:MAG: metallophosphoesterase family protein [Dehalococcoidia bacterium]|nr:metallophosphoesterase family protein [Dehalococcoidia bacterium]
MRVLVVADVHGNLTAFETVIADARRRGGFDAIACAGDIVGYGPAPGECLALLRSFPHVAVAGNHDWGAVGKVNLRDFNPAAAEVCRWAGAQLNAEQRTYLEDLPLTTTVGDLTLAHGSPRDPVWEYLVSESAAQQCFPLFSTPACLVGHSHLPLLFEQRAGGSCNVRLLEPNKTVSLEGRRLIFNPGGVGQPRDRDPRAAYALYDHKARSLTHHRVAYDVAATQEAMRLHRLPQSLIERLSHGV